MGLSGVAHPRLVVVSGPAGSGTTTLADELAGAIPCPTICRDRIKEGLVHGEPDYAPAPGDPMNERAFETFFGVVGFLVDAGAALVVEASFQHGLWEAGLGPLLDRASVRVLRCRVDAAVARERIARRLEEVPVRKRIHGDYSLLEPFETWKPKFEAFQAIDLPVPTMDVDTTRGYDPPLDEIVAFVNTP